MLRRTFIRLRLAWRKLLAIDATPQAIARGFAVGIFMAMMPVLGIQTIAAIVLAFLVRGNKPAAVLGTLVTNPLTFGPVVWVEHVVGSYVLYGRHDPRDAQVLESALLSIDEAEDLPIAEAVTHAPATLMGTGWRIYGAMLLGGLLLGVIFAAASYFLVLWAAGRAKRKRELRLARRMAAAMKRVVLPKTPRETDATPAPPDAENR